jgi:hypothetical protein
VSEESWDGELGTVTSVKELHSVNMATYGACPTASVELRTREDGEGGRTVRGSSCVAPAAHNKYTDQAEKESHMSTEDRPASGGAGGRGPHCQQGAPAACAGVSRERFSR